MSPRRTPPATALLVLLLLFLLPLAARAGCDVERLAAIPLQFTDMAIALPVEINGITATFILDTGAQRSLVTDAAVQRLGLARDHWVGTTMRGIGGIDRRANADPRSITLGGIPLVRRTLNHDTSLTVGELPRAGAGARTIDGLLGRDFLSLFDLDLDVPGRRLTLDRVGGCAGHFLPWTGNYTVMPVTFAAGQAIILPVTLDGRNLRAMLDTGASSSLLAAPGIFKLGLDRASLAGDPSDQISGLGPRTVTVYRHRFRSLTVGAETGDTPILWVEPVQLSPIVDMLLGADWLSARRVWISYATSQVFISS